MLYVMCEVTTHIAFIPDCLCFCSINYLQITYQSPISGSTCTKCITGRELPSLAEIYICRTNMHFYSETITQANLLNQRNKKTPTCLHRHFQYSPTMDEWKTDSSSMFLSDLHLAAGQPWMKGN